MFPDNMVYSFESGSPARSWTGPECTSCSSSTLEFETWSQSTPNIFKLKLGSGVTDSTATPITVSVKLKNVLYCLPTVVPSVTAKIYLNKRPWVYHIRGKEITLASDHTYNLNVKFL